MTSLGFPYPFSSYIQSRAAADTLSLRYLRKGVERNAIIALKAARATLQTPK